MDALARNGERAAYAVELLEEVFDNALPFQLPSHPRDEWDYLNEPLFCFYNDFELARASFSDNGHALDVGLAIGSALAVRRLDHVHPSG
jgi:hypothetical protein